MTGPSRQRTWSDVVPVFLLALTLVLTGCQAGQPRPPSSSRPVTAPSIDPEVPTVHFTAQGDVGVGTGARQVLDTIAGLRPQLNLGLGDYSYRAGIEQEFCDMVTGKLGSDFPYQVVTGNHESDGHDGDIANLVKCLPNRLPGLRGEYGTQWYVDYPEKDPLVRFIMVSPGITFHDGNTLNYSPNSRRWNWTARALDGAKSRNIPWTVVGMHTPCLSVGRYDCQAGQDFTNMLIKKKADLVLTGHEHLYQRSHQLGGGTGCPILVPDAFSRDCITDSDASMVEGEGTVFATVGTGGVGLYDVRDDDSEARYFASWSGGNRDPALGTLDVTATADRLSARFVPAEGYTFTDSFDIERK